MSQINPDPRAEIERNLDRLPLPTFPCGPEPEPKPWLYEFYPPADTTKEPAK